MDEDGDLPCQRLLRGARAGIRLCSAASGSICSRGRRVNFPRYSTTMLSAVLMKNW